MSLFIQIFIVISFVAFLINWKSAIYFCLIVGFIQDPIRKIVPGQPVYYQFLVGWVFCIIILKMFIKTVRIRWSSIAGNSESLRNAWKAYFIMILLQCFHTLFRFDNLILAGMGLFSWLLPVSAIIIGSYFLKNENNIYKILMLYIVFAIPFSLSIYFSYYYQDTWNILKDVGSFSGRQLIIYRYGNALQSYAGFFRVGEIAAWHAATAATFLIILSTINKSMLFRVFSAIIFISLIGAVLLTGRRKMLMNLTIFIGVYWFCLSFFWQKAGKVSLLIFIICIFSSVLVWIHNPDREYAIYAQLGGSVYESIPDRFGTAMNLLQSSVNRYGLLGTGAGVISTGSQYFGGGSDLVGGAGEAGFGRIVTELGIVGFLIIICLSAMIIRYFYRSFKIISPRYYSLTIYMAGFTSIIVANIATFFAATQLYGDMFILIMLGLIFGFLFKLSLLAQYYTFQKQS